MPEAPASSGDPWQRVGHAIRDALTGVNNAAVGALNTGAQAIGSVIAPPRPDYSQPARDIQERQATLTGEGPSIADVVSAEQATPSPSRQVFDTVAGGARAMAEGSQAEMARFQELSGRQLQGETLTPDEEAELARAAINVVGDVSGLTSVGRAVPGVIGRAAERVRGVPEPAPSTGIVSRAQADEARPAVDRYYHGTGSDFARPDPGKFDPNGLFGPGYYLSDDARVPGGYAEARTPAVNSRIDELTTEQEQLREVLSGKGPWGNDARQRAFAVRRLPEVERELATLEPDISGGPNIRPVDVPRDLRLLDTESPVSVREFDSRIAPALEPYLSDPLVDHYRGLARRGELSGDTMWRQLIADFKGDSRSVNTVLADAGYDGIRYSGGKRIPMQDEAGKAIEHNAVVIFPESLDKITNATARTPGGFVPGAPSGARDTAGQPGEIIAAGGRAVGSGAGAAYAESQQEGATPESILRAGVGGAATSIARSGTGALLRPGRRPPIQAGVAPERLEPLEQQGESLPPGARRIGLSTDEEIARLRLDKFPEEAREDIAKAARDVNWARTQRRGVLSDDVVAEMAEDMARRGDAWIRDGRAGRAYNPEETVALRNLVTGQAVRVRELSEEIATARTTGSTPDLLIAQRAAEAAKLEGYVKLAEGARAEAGRTLRQYTNDARLIDSDPDEAIERIYRRLGGRDNATKAVDEYTKLVQDGADPFQMAKFWSKVEKPPPGASDWFATLRYNSMLSGPRTFEINTIGSATEIPWRIARDFGASTLRGRPEEIAPELTGLWVGAQKGAQAFMETLAHGITLEQASRGDLPRGLATRVENPIARGVATTLESPGRVMQATDEMFRQMAFAMGKYRLAAVTASKEGLRGDAWSQRIAQLVEDSPKAMVLQAEGIADRMTYHNDMGQLGRALGEVQRVPYLGNIVMPFLRTVYNITARGIDRSPVGAFGTAIDVARGVYQPGKELPKGVMPLGERIGDNIMGSGIIAGVYLIGEAMKGLVSGAGPDDTEKREQLRAQGWMPYSVKIGDSWVSYSNWGPVSIGLAQAAATAEANIYRKPDATDAERTVDALRRFGELSTEQTYLQGIGAFYKAVKEPDVYGTQWLTQFMQTLVPFGSAINTAGQATDPIQRRPDRGDIGQAMAGRFPDLPGDMPFVEGRTSVPAQQDVLGRPVPSTAGGASALNPFRVSPERADALIGAFQRAGVDIGQPPKKIGDVELTPDEQRRYQRIMGEAIQRSAGPMLTDLGDMPSSVQASILQNMYRSARQYAENMIKINPEYQDKRLQQMGVR